MTHYTDRANLVASLEALREDQPDDFRERTQADTIRLDVLDTTEARIIAETRESLEDRNLFGRYDQLCTLKLEGSRLELAFHENIVDGEFCLSPAGPHAIDPEQATQPTDLSEALASVLPAVEEAFDIHKWDFSKVNGASIAHGGHITDYEFTFDTFMN